MENTQYLTTEELAAEFKLSKRWIYFRTRQDGPEGIPHMKFGKHIRFDKKKVLEFFEQQKKNGVRV